MYLLTAITIYMSLVPGPFLHLAERFASPSVKGEVPVFEAPWRFLVLFPYIGGFVLFALGRINARLRDRAALIISAATLYFAWQAGDRQHIPFIYPYFRRADLCCRDLFPRVYAK
ncbi:hypothetical protein GTU79_09615 [Sodalis ligni]|uniref:hypothetical protein n=1 Tax=Sodalis ligni TaxID=2697027 RepID=UPI001BDE0F1D|nr:hypothetical protein [Sodalis ligni]QWA12907.1 hypothetical protein GTU79_09615 [Sodalis ligni]